MMEMDSTSNDFTWSGTRNNQCIQCKLDRCFGKLDRCFGNTALFSMFPHAHQWFLQKLESDHKPVLVKFTNDKELFRGQLQFDKRWAEDPTFLEVIHRSWNRDKSNIPKPMMVRTAHCRRAISLWKKKSWSNSEIGIKRLRDELTAQDESRNPFFYRINQE
ncbi:hypothetical protein V5N11_009084 [Cardamine amara subsp. amara]|uniref:Uncharacterized protein n=1 Tax=Cardamine amara subsp. amara TaxID=228776 RepID=A0ABD1C7I5_CARAN